MTMKTIVAATLAAGFATAAAAHHSPAMYNRQAAMTVDATVKNLNWVNPHAMLTVEVDAKAGQPAKTLTVEMSSPGVLTRAGWSKRTFNPGDRVTLEFAPLRNGQPVGLFMKATLQKTGQVLTWNFRPGEAPGLE